MPITIRAYPVSFMVSLRSREGAGRGRWHGTGSAPVPWGRAGDRGRSGPGHPAEHQADAEPDQQRRDRVAADHRGDLPAEVAELVAGHVVGVRSPVLDPVGRLAQPLAGVTGPLPGLVPG